MNGETEKGGEKGIEMTRNLKIISLALLLGVVVIGALAVTGAFAGEEAEGGGEGELHPTAGYPAILDGTDIATELNAFTLFGMVIKCPDSSYTGEVIGGETKSFTVIPTYGKNCTETATNRTATVKTNGCGYKLTLRKTTIQDKIWVDNYFFTTDIICGGNDIEIIIYEAVNNEDAEFCKITIKEQGLKDRGKLQNVLKPGTTTTNGELKLENKIEGIVADKSGKCMPKQTTIGQLHIGITIKGTTKAGGPNPLEVTDGEPA
jgi:hypothetical protein